MKSKSFFQIVIGLFLVMSLLFVSAQVAVAAESEHPLLTQKELEIQKIARKRLYVGGQDEEPLKVQKELFKPIRKETAEEEPPSSED